MATKRDTSTPRAARREARAQGKQFCDVRVATVPELRSDLNPNRAALILQGRSKWVNGTTLRYYFFDKRTDGEHVPIGGGRTRFVSWVGPEAQREAVRKAFTTWKNVGIGLRFEEVDDRNEAEVRIGFMAGDGSWSYVGRDVLGISQSERTMNFGWDLTSPWGRVTALHEIGHTLGFPHEHQNPYAGIVWNRPAVLAYFSGPPNNWPAETIEHNILRKLDQRQVEGSQWDPSSVMHYPFEPGLIDKPEKYAVEGIPDPTGLSERDKQWALKWYPSPEPAGPPVLNPFESQKLSLKPGGQANFRIQPAATREYEFSTFGAADTVMVLFEEVDGKLRYRAGDDDSGLDRNAQFTVKLFKNSKYVLRVRLYSAWRSGDTAVMYW